MFVTPMTSPLCVEQRAAAVARIDLRRRLNVGQPLAVAVLRADDPLGHRAFQTERVADREDFFALFLIIGIGQQDRLERQIFLLGDLQQSQIEELIHGDDLHFVDAPPGVAAFRVLRE